MPPPDRTRAFLFPPLRGERDYVHVADIVAGIYAATPARADIALRLTAPAACAIEIVAAPSGAATELVCGRFSHGGDSPGRYDLVLHPELPLTERIAPDEDAMLAGARIAGQRIDGPPSSDFSFVERLSALAIELLLESDPDDYWRVAGLAFTERPPDDAAPGFAIVSCVGRRFWKGIAFADGRAIGHVVFVLAPRPPGAAPTE